jgi:hypothetical protein
MLSTEYANWRSWLLLGLWLGLTVFGLACRSTEPETTIPPGIRTQLLVRAPDRPLPVNRPVTVRSRIEDGNGVSHIELYLVEMPSGERNVLVRADKAPFSQTSFTAAQTFTPRQKGHYVIKVVGYSRLGERDESDFIGFDVE